MVACAFSILCNKWRIFHCVIDIYPDFCDVIVKTCCILHNFIHLRDGFQFQDISYECSLESIQAVSTRDMSRRAQRTGISLHGGPIGKHGRGLIYWGLVWKKALQMGTSLHRGPVGMHWGGNPFTRNLIDGLRRALETGHLSLWALCEGNLEGGLV
jgi:hypothetical protein